MIQRGCIVLISGGAMFAIGLAVSAAWGMQLAATFLSLETAWHFTACKSHDRDLKPCVFKQVKEMAVRHR